MSASGSPPTPDETASLATSDEIRAYLIDRLNLALRRPGVFGGESGLGLLLDPLLFVERRPEALEEQREEWRGRGVWNSLGVTGAFGAWVADNRYDSGAASLYAEFAHRQGWFAPDRVLDADEYGALRACVRDWAGEDRVWADVTDAFGEPSALFGGTNPLYGKTLGYLSEDPDEPMVAFHLWNGTSPDGEWPQYQEPRLLAVRFGDGPLRDTFTFTPEGRRRLSLQPRPPV